MAPALRPRESCDQCGFDSDLYDRPDTVSSQRFLGAVLAAAVEDMPEALMSVRPDAQTWSIGEYLDHVREVIFGNRFVIDFALGEPGVDLGNSPTPDFEADARTVDAEAALREIGAEALLMHERLRSLEPEQWATPLVLDGAETTVGWFARHVIHDALHHLGDIGAIRRELGYGPPGERGSLIQINVSGGGVPKQPVDVAIVSAAGVAGDAQADRQHHGRPAQAVCLWSADVIASLQDEGHPIAPGLAGENLTVDGLTWSELRPGARLEVGELSLLISAHAVPCAKNAQWFSDGDFARMSHARHPGWSRLYAIPLNRATVSTGDVVTVG